MTASADDTMIISRPMSTESPVSPKPAAQLMLWTYIIGGTGYFVGIFTLQQDPPSLLWAALLAVTVTGILSFLRHALFNRSDAVHGGWDYGRRNSFQIEVGPIIGITVAGLMMVVMGLFDMVGAMNGTA